MRFERVAAAVDGSVVLGAIRRVTHSSLLVSAARALLRPARVAPIDYCSRDDAAICSLFRSSRLVASIDGALISCGRIWQHAEQESYVRAIARVDLPERISLTGVALMAATVTNLVLAVGFGAPLGPLAWLLRAGCIAFGALCARYPERVAAAWTSWRRPLR
jgi:hypothetical protein